MSRAPTKALSTKLRDLGEAWLSLRCTSRTTQIPMKMMAESYGTHQSLGEILPKLRCRQCGQAPERIELTDDPTRNACGKVRNVDAWAIDLSALTRAALGFSLYLLMRSRGALACSLCSSFTRLPRTARRSD
jgi:hypothetical protein